MLSVTSPRSSQTPSLWAAPPAASWTTEEISMIQEMFLSDDNAIQVQDISIYDSKQPVAEDLLAISVEQGADATSMLLSPIGADDAFLQQFMVDEKVAMTAFFLEAIDPFKNVPMVPNPIEQEPVSLVPVVSAVISPSDGRPVDHVLAKLRTKMNALNRIYYSRCMNMSDADDSSVNKAKLVLAIERLQRVVQGLSIENARLKTDTTSCAQRCELLLKESSDGRAELEQLSQSIDGSTCTTAVTAGMNLALNYSMDGEVLRDHQSENGWKYKSVVSPDGMFIYSLSKEYSKEVNMHEVMQKSWTSVSSSENFSSIYYGSIKAKLVKKVGKEAIIMYDIANYDATRVDRVVAVLFRVEIPNGFLLGMRSLDVSLTTTSKNIHQMNCTAWQRYECKEDGGFVVTSCGQLSYPSRADIDFMAIEIMCLHLRWESRVMGLQLIV
ncbi:unnamed protein product [Peronospora farinosa]|uniref:START domain-containing protein n=1 Tax=Peronospora farinosa TaxID=134698 RepID=A0AAV0SY42_9STRA|nr:unnamed protein product [Peronospora farinosa]CAI5708895.1 unnamed protein product [Peronospora farinosa]